MSEPSSTFERPDESKKYRKKWRYFSLGVLLVVLGFLSRIATLRTASSPSEPKEDVRSAPRCPAETIEDEGLCVPLTRVR